MIVLFAHVARIIVYYPFFHLIYNVTWMIVLFAHIARIVVYYSFFINFTMSHG